ncbi:hypothetical protein GN956_G26538 [Arapaima gigas]
MHRGVARLVPLLWFCLLAGGQHVESRGNDRPFAVLRNQNLVVLLSVLCVIVVAMIVMAVCVYKPLRRR